MNSNSDVDIDDWIGFGILLKIMVHALLQSSVDEHAGYGMDGSIESQGEMPACWELPDSAV